jgi:hypothetical protein
MSSTERKEKLIEDTENESNPYATDTTTGNTRIVKTKSSLALGIHTGENTENLPKIRSFLVKVFLSSTFTGNISYLFLKKKTY